MSENEKVLCWVNDWGFAMYDPQQDLLSFTYVVQAASEATRADWERVMTKRRKYPIHFMQRKQP